MKKDSKKFHEDVQEYRHVLYKSSSSNSAPESADEPVERLYFQRLIKNHFPSNLEVHILDLGCGNGALIHILQRKGYVNCRGVDITAARKDFPSVTTGSRVEANLMEFIKGSRDESFDVIVAFDLMEHFTKKELFNLTREIYRALKPNGVLIIHVPNAEGLFGARIRYADYTHQQAFTGKSIKQLFTACHFEQVDCYEDQPIVHGVKSGIRWVGWKILRTILAMCCAIETGEMDKDLIFSQNLLAIARKT